MFLFYPMSSAHGVHKGVYFSSDLTVVVHFFHLSSFCILGLKASDWSSLCGCLGWSGSGTKKRGFSRRALLNLNSVSRHCIWHMYCYISWLTCIPFSLQYFVTLRDMWIEYWTLNTLNGMFLSVKLVLNVQYVSA